MIVYISKNTGLTNVSALYGLNQSVDLTETSPGTYKGDLPIGTPKALYVLTIREGTNVCGYGEYLWDGEKEVSILSLEETSSLFDQTTKTHLLTIPTDTLRLAQYEPPNNLAIADIEAKLDDVIIELDKVSSESSVFRSLVNVQGTKLTASALSLAPSGGGSTGTGTGVTPELEEHILAIPTDPLRSSQYVIPSDLKIDQLLARVTENRMAKLDIVATTTNANLFKGEQTDAYCPPPSKSTRLVCPVCARNTGIIRKEKWSL